MMSVRFNHGRFSSSRRSVAVACTPAQLFLSAVFGRSMTNLGNLKAGEEHEKVRYLSPAQERLLVEEEKKKADARRAAQRLKESSANGGSVSICLDPNARNRDSSRRESAPRTKLTRPTVQSNLSRKKILSRLNSEINRAMTVGGNKGQHHGSNLTVRRSSTVNGKDKLPGGAARHHNARMRRSSTVGAVHAVGAVRYLGHRDRRSSKLAVSSPSKSPSRNRANTHTE